jgi:hypothetical protein
MKLFEAALKLAGGYCSALFFLLPDGIHLG